MHGYEVKIENREDEKITVTLLPGKKNGGNERKGNGNMLL